MSPKPFKSYSEQLQILKDRGLHIEDEATALHLLEHHSYYRLSAYRFPLQQAVDQFKQGTSFDQLWKLYCFDRILRYLVSEACKAFELSVRARWAYLLSQKYGAQAYEDPSVFRNPQLHTSLLASLDRELDRSDEVFIKHYRENYQMQRPPIWGACEVMSFGLISRFYENIARDADKKAIASGYQLSIDGLKSLLEHSVYLRNLCAHHSRLWNRRFTITVSLPTKRPTKVVESLNPMEDRRIYNSLVLLGHLLSIVEPGSDWQKRLYQHLQTLPAAMHADLGFPPDWQNRPAWLPFQTI
jgi:abortive infection bacteriophage resistance protein